MNRSRRWSSILALAAAGAALATFPTCRSTKHTVARIVEPAARPTEVFVPAPVEPPPPPATRAPRASTPIPPPPPPVTRAPQASTPIPPPSPRATRVPQASTPIPPPSPTPTVAAMEVVTTPAAPVDRSPGVLYEQMVPTAVAVTPIPTAGPVTPIPTAVAVTPTQTPRSRREPQPTQTPRAGAAPKPGTYYEDEEGRPLPTPTPVS